MLHSIGIGMWKFLRWAEAGGSSAPVSLIRYNPPHRMEISGAAILLILRTRSHAAYPLFLLSILFSPRTLLRGALLFDTEQVIGKMPMPLLSARQLFTEGP
jgi:hypothetical protein